MSLNRLCGCFVDGSDYVRKYLPQVSVKAHSTILATTSRTTLAQTFTNSWNCTLDEANYIFPLYDGVSVVSFKCTIGDRVIEGLVKERDEAKKEYEEAKEDGLIAGLMEQSLDASDVFTTSIGNVPKGAEVQVEIQFVSELKQDFQTEGIRFTLPTELFPRYDTGELAGHVPSSTVIDGGFSATLDIQLPEGTAIKSVQSPSHPIDVNIGTTSVNRDVEPSLSVASATISQSRATLDTDLVVVVTPSKTGEPVALLETHATLPNQRALMTSLIPKFVLPAETPEIVFVCDRSGSMEYNMEDLRKTLNIFIKSLPAGVAFNICSFGSRFDFLWPSSRNYDQQSVDKAIKHVSTMSANYGGTEMYQPIEAVFKQRLPDRNLEVFVLTDGGIWQQDELFDLINKESTNANGNMRLFSLGIGSGASTSLVEGMARAGNGFAQFVADGEKMDSKVVRMLKASLYPHIDNVKLELEYGGGEDGTDDFELIDAQSTVIETEPASSGKAETTESGEKPADASADKSEKVISLFDTEAKVDEAPPPAVPPLPTFGPQPYVQTPSTIPPLFPFHRSTVYVFLNETSPVRPIKSVILSADSKHGKLRLTIPVDDVGRGTTIHQLAARKESHELEEGRGFIASMRDENGKAGRDRFPAQWDAIVKREAISYGLRYQVANKWCSFVAVEKRPDGKVEETKRKIFIEPIDYVAWRRAGGGADGIRVGGAPSLLSPLRAPLRKAKAAFGAPLRRGGPPPPPCPAPAPAAAAFNYPEATPRARPGVGALFGGGMLRRARASLSGPSGALFGSAPAPQAEAVCAAAPTHDALADEQACKVVASSSDSAAADEPALPEGASALETLTALQNFDGSWDFTPALEAVLGLSPKEAQVLDFTLSEKVLATALAVAYFRTELADQSEVWELMVQKAEHWLWAYGGQSKSVSGAVDQAKKLLASKAKAGKK